MQYTRKQRFMGVAMAGILAATMGLGAAGAAFGGDNDTEIIDDVDTPAASATATGKTLDSAIQVTGVEDRANVTAYQIVRDKGNGQGWELVGNYGTGIALNSDGSLTMDADKANTIAAAIKGGAAVGVTYTLTGENGTYAYANPAAGTYLVIVEPTDASVVYKAMVVSADYKSDNDSYTAAAKKSNVTIDKKAGGEQTSTGHDVGDEITYTIEVTNPKYPSNATSHIFKVTDTLPDTLGFVSGTTSVDGVNVSASGKNITADFSSAILDVTADTITVTVTARINDTAFSNNDYSNNAELEFTTNPYADGTYKINDIVPGKTYGVEFDKVGADDETKTLTDAVFTVKINGAALKDANGNDVTIRYDASKRKYVLPSGLAAGIEYTLEETTVPAGYSKAADTKFNISTTGDELFADDADDSDYIYAIANAIVDPTQAQLPSTGGMGTTLLYLGGTALVGGAAIALVARRRASAEM